MREPLGKLVLKDFQAHDEFEIALDPGVTTIVGPSDVGKSSIIRALRWVSLNDPAGDSFIRWGKKNVKVSLDTVIRRKGSKGNVYELEGREFVSFGNTVPPEVEKFLAVGDVNFQGQYDRPFWLGDSAGEVSRQLNKVVNLEIIDTVLGKLNSLGRDAGARVSLLEDRVEEARVLRDSLNSVPDMEEELEEILVQETAVALVLTDIEALLRLIAHATEALASTRMKTSCAKDAEALLEVCELWEMNEVFCLDLGKCVVSLEKAQSEVERDVPDLGNIVELAQASFDLREPVSRLGSVIDLLTAAEQEAEVLLIEHKEAKNALSDEMEDECPLCGRSE